LTVQKGYHSDSASYNDPKSKHHRSKATQYLPQHPKA